MNFIMYGYTYLMIDYEGEQMVSINSFKNLGKDIESF